jgi:hypothetical protein
MVGRRSIRKVPCALGDRRDSAPPPRDGRRASLREREECPVRSKEETSARTGPGAGRRMLREDERRQHADDGMRLAETTFRPSTSDPLPGRSTRGRGSGHDARARSLPRREPRPRAGSRRHQEIHVTALLQPNRLALYEQVESNRDTPRLSNRRASPRQATKLPAVTRKKGGLVPIQRRTSRRASVRGRLQKGSLDDAVDSTAPT